MPRKNKVNHLFKGLRKSKEYSVAEIVELAENKGLLEEVYPDAEHRVRVRKAKQLVQSHINAHDIPNSGFRNNIKTYSGEHFINHEEARAEWIAGVEAAVTGRVIRRSRLLTALAVIFLVTTTGFLLYPESHEIESTLTELERAGDIAGLKAWDRAWSERVPIIDETEAAALIDDIGHDLGVALPLTIDVDSYRLHPYRERVASAISRIERHVHPIDLDDLVAVFPHLEDPMWVFSGERGRCFPVTIGTNIRLDGEVAYVTEVTTYTIAYRRQMGTSDILERPPYRLPMGRSETRRAQSIILHRPEGNLVPLVEFLGRTLELGVVLNTDRPGQIAGFFPPILDLEELIDLLEPLGLSHRGDNLVLDSHPEIKLEIGFHQDKIFWASSLDHILGNFDELLPHSLSWPSDQELYLYTGQSFQQVCRGSGLIPKIDGASISLLR